MENRSHALIAGLFTLALIVLATLLAIWLGRDKIQRVPYIIVTKTAVSGLNLQAAVRYKGIKVGNVTDIDFDARTPGQIILRLEVLPDTPVTRSTFATLAYQGVTGIAFVQLDDDPQSTQALLQAQADDAPPRIPLRPGTLQTLEQHGLAILTQTEELTRRLNSLLDPQNQKTIISSIDNVNKAALAWQAMPARLEPGLAQLPVLMSETQQTLQSVHHLSDNAAQLSRSLTQLSDQLQTADGPVARFNTALDQINRGIVSDTLPRIQSLAGEARSSLRSLNRTAETLNERPQSLLFGSPATPPGPGETGFTAPRSASR
ncbi:MlaD family protein [Undibacterium oligocarboniphilum]|uniref:MCE family protein n=1 Tax=Undibacterium oligocarboniphilum TaxID=666702 RepID=A0A850QIL2_9BURK|nr:MlaD family protein [Undibacterium oligocarboniphilum]MBC3871693.1 MCE family protein [Undibacterium oligocarboniphilum]NVO79118.1 MCE family protein [Undibacterium oligocarboniphilum]